MRGQPARREALGATAGLAGVAVIVALLRASTGAPNAVLAALVLLVAVLATSTISTLRVAVGVAIAATLAFNFFFLPPLHTFTIADPQNWVALFLFLAVAGVIAFAIERGRLLEERKVAGAATERAELASALLASFSHDLRTPLTALRVAVTNLQGHDEPDPDRRVQAEIAMTEIDRLARLFQNILDMARIDTGTIVTERQWVTPADIVDAAIAQVGAPLARRDLLIDAEALEVVEVDPRLTSSALAHLLENAAAYSPVSSAIDVRAWHDPDGLHIVVRDRGPGLDVAEREQVFQPLYRGSRAGRQSSGSGMGLAITRGLLATEGGRVWCENAAGGGAQFTIVVPAAVRPILAQEA